ncbi:energy-coupled thiamine transporter ThiT [Aquibacillus rhizosphaerae]|uniref:Energy-coupled thiamine transporter ThiT n=1 Tax=Aquibacillus rhizosphaerae TaxID=3051431 RepID=A0ABT7L8H6_9BACI|nr:energy-coupled thiamine transporter ThiT [Aquibacillus sp. LR5S19]MDL4842186.1 energy-coupled thiamine transporter ThiT [Aquibacillus sp. LR5S19]
MSSKRTLFLIEVAIFTAFALVLDLLPFLSFKVWAQGGSISFAMVPIFIVAFRWGLKGGLLSGLLFGLLQIATGTAWIMHPVQGFIDYALAFTVIGFAGLFAAKVQQNLKSEDRSAFIINITFGVLLACVLRFIAHFIAGIVFFESLIDGMNIWMYSLVYNGSYLIPSFILNTIIVAFLFNKRPRLIQVTN